MSSFVVSEFGTVDIICFILGMFPSTKEVLNSKLQVKEMTKAKEQNAHEKHKIRKYMGDKHMFHCFCDTKLTMK